ncbi:MAG TPA: glycosyltransferase, partial [Leptospiraceae bacterium]|nr:glycosyltransferase [Leptospiraceae bacterium]
MALVVQRYSDVTGGSEAEARAYAQLLRSRFEVEVITTTAKDVATWANELPPGESEEDGVLVRRFSVTTGRSRYWEALYDILLRSQAAEAKTTVAFQEEWIRRQGPHSDGLLAFLAANKSAYRAFLYFTYLYSPAYFGTQCTPAERNILIPTLHDEPAARMTCFRAFAERTSAMIFNSEAEMQLAMELWNVRAGAIAGFPVACPERPSLSADSYVLYAGRIEPGKGCDEMFEYFAEFARANPGVRLVLIGKKDMKLPAGNLVEFAGFVTEEKKQELMARAICLLMPSRNE